MGDIERKLELGRLEKDVRGGLVKDKLGILIKSLIVKPESLEFIPSKEICQRYNVPLEDLKQERVTVIFYTDTLSLALTKKVFIRAGTTDRISSKSKDPQMELAIFGLTRLPNRYYLDYKTQITSALSKAPQVKKAKK